MCLQRHKHKVGDKILTLSMNERFCRLYGIGYDREVAKHFNMIRHEVEQN